MGLRLRLPSRTRISRWTIYALFAGLFITLPVSIVTSAPVAQAFLLSTPTDNPSWGGGGGGDTYRAQNCGTNSVVVGFSIAGTSGVAILCRTLNNDGTIPNTAHTTSNTTKLNIYGAPSTNVFCPTGTVASQLRIQSNGYANGGGLYCQTPPLMTDTITSTDLIAGSGTLGVATCAAGSVMSGAWAVTGAWLDRVGPRCSTYNKYGITYNVNGGSTTAPANTTQILPGDTLAFSNYAGVRTGYTFGGWTTVNNGTGTHYDVGETLTPTANLTVFAQWLSTITYDSNTALSGTAPNPTIALGTAANTTLATNSGSMAKPGYSFTGWNTRADGSGTNYVAGLTTFASPGDITLYAQWNSTITYNGNGNTSASSTVPAARTITGTAGNTFLLPAPTTLLRTNFTFAGWNTAANRSGTSYAPGETFTASGSTTLFAMWNLNITFNGNTPTTGTVPSTITTNESQSPTIPGNTGNLTKTGFTFVGWNTLADGTGTRFIPGETITATGNTTLFAQWIATCTTSTSYANNQQLSTFTSVDTCAWTLPEGISAIDFMVVGGGGGGGGNVGTAGSGGGTNIQINIPVNPGQIVIKTLGAGGSGGFNTANGNAGAATSLTIGRTVYSAGGGSGGLTLGNSSKPTLCTTTTGAPAAGSGGGAGGPGGRGGWGSPSSGANPCNGIAGVTSGFSGQSLTYGSGGGGGGWNIAGIGLAGGSDAGNGASATYGNGVAALPNRGGGGGGSGPGGTGGAGGSGLLIIGWSVQSSITYDSNTAVSGVSTETRTVQVNPGDSLTVTSAGTLSKPGFTFSGWNTQANGQGTNIPVGSTYTPQGPVRLFAQWNYVVTYDGNGFTSVPNTLADSVTVTSSISTITLDSATALARTGYRLTGWNTQANGSGTNFALGSTNWKSDTGAITLYAQWSATISFSLNGGDTGTVPASINTTGTGNGTFNLPSPTNFRKAGLTFVGWNTAANGTGTFYAPGASFTTTGTATLFAQFNAILTYLSNGATAGSAPSQVSSPVGGNNNGCKVETGYTHCRVYTFPTAKSPVTSGLTLDLVADSSYINGTNWYDKSANGFRAVANNSPTFNAAERAWSLNGTNQFFNLGNILNYTSGAFTVEVTFKPNSVTGTQALISRYNTGVAGNYFMLLNGDKVRYSFEASPHIVNGPTSVTTGTKHVATQVFNGSSLATYLNGLSNGGTTPFSTSYGSTVNLLIGAIYNNSVATNFFNGLIYSVRIYNRALSAAEVAQNYEAEITEIPTTFNQSFVIPGAIPAGDKILVEAWGAGGGGAFHPTWSSNGAGGAGGYSKSTVATTGSTETLTVVVGQGGEAYDLTPQYGGGGAGGLSPDAQKGSSGGGMSGIFIGSDTTTPLIIVGGGGGSSPGSANTDGGGGGGSIGAGAGATFANRTGRGGTLIAGGAAATATTLCTIAPTAGRSQQGGSGAGHPTTNNEGGGGGGGGLFGGGGGHCDGSQSNGGGGGGSGFVSSNRVTVIASQVGATGIVTAATAPGGLNSINYSYVLGNGGDANIGVGFGGNGNPLNPYAAKGGDGMVIIHWNEPGDSWIASANVNSMEKPGFRFTGWNTKADGTGVHYDTGTALERTNTTLYAEWSYTITYDGNGHTSGTPPPPQIATSGDPVTTIADNPATAVKSGYFWDGWNTQANGKGRNFTANSDLLGLPRPYMRYVASDYNASTKVWTDSSGNGRNATSVRGTPTRTTSGAVFGMFKDFATVRGTTASGITLPNAKLDNYTLCFIARYAGATRNRIFETVSENWVTGFLGDATGVAYHNAWITPTSSTAGDLLWGIHCDSGDTFRFNGVNRSTATSTTKYLPASLSINSGLYGVQGYNSDWEVAEVIAYDSYLTTTQMQQIESYFADTYGYESSGSTQGLPTPYLQYEASNYDAASKVWLDSSGNNRDATVVRGMPTVVTNAPANGSTKNVTVVKGGITAGITLPNPRLENYTLCYVARYAGGNQRRIFDALSENWLSGFWNGSVDVAVHTGWITPSSGKTGTDWVYNCDSGNNFRSNGIVRNNATSNTYLPVNITINNFGGTGRSNETSDWEVAEVVLYETSTTSAQMTQIEGYLRNKYGLWTPTISSRRITNFASPTGDLTLYAQWNSYISYESNTATSGSVPLPTLMVADTAVAVAANTGTLARTGNSFLGWNTLANGQGTSWSVNETYTPTANITLFAQWGSGVTFNSNSATSGSAPANQILRLSETMTLTSGTLARTNYTFAGWNTLANGSGTRYETGTSFSAPSNITLFAQWNSLIRFDVNGGSGAPNVDSVTATGTLNVTLATAGTMMRTGFSFGGWNTRADGTGTLYSAGLTTYAPAGNITLFARWTGNPYTVTYNGNTHTSGSTASKAITGGTPAAMTANGFVKTGYTFLGWSESSTATTATFTDGSTQTFFSNKTLFAIWKPDVYTITYNANSALGAATKSSETYTVGTTGLTLTTVGTMVKQGYRFGGWATTSAGTTALTSPYVATSSIILYAIWTPNQYRLFYDSNTAISGSLNSILFTAGQSFNLNGNLNFTKPGFTAIGFNTAANGSGTFYAGGASITLFDTTTVYSQWVPVAPAAPTISVVPGNTTATINVNGGTLSGTNGPADSFTVTARLNGVVVGSCIVLSPATSCRISGLTNNTAYTFTAIASNATGTSTASTGVNGTPRGFVVTYNPSGGVVLPTSDTFSVGTPLIFPLPTRSGYNFLGWFDTSTAGTNLGLNGGLFSPTESRTVFAQWSAIPYTIFYNGNGNTSGAAPANGTYSLTSGAYVILGRNTLAKTGYLFNGWLSETGTVFTVGSSYSRLANINLYARWVAETYTVTYNANGGSGSVPIRGGTVTIGETFTAASTSLTLAGSNFAGWSDGTRTYLPGEVITVGGSNITLTALWNSTQYVVTYSLNGGTGSAPTSPNFYMNETFTVASIGSVTKSGYTFNGWVESGTAFAAGSTYTMPSRNIDFIAQWSGLVYTINYATTGATTGSPSRSSDSFTFGTSGISLPTAGSMVKAGYTFEGWRETSTVISGAYTPTANVTLQPVWSATTQTFTFDVNGATGTTPSSASHTTDGTAVTAPAQGNLVKPGFTFGGWSDGTNTYQAGNPITGTSSKTLTAIWTPATFAITYLAGIANSNQVTIPIGLPTTSATAYGSTFVLGNLETRTVVDNGLTYAFAGWTSNGQTYQVGSTIVMGTSAPTFTASWLRLYEVRYYMTGGTDPGMTQGVLYSNGATVTIDPLTPLRTGYTFTRWNDQSGNAVVGNTYQISDTNYLFYAHWTINSYALAFNSAGGSTAPNTTNANFGSFVTLPASNSVTKPGYTFAGWSIAGSTYVGGAQYQIGSSAETATAIWSPTLQSITFDLAQGSSNTAISEPSRTIGETFTVSSTIPIRTGYTFAGWSDGSTTYNPGSTVTVGATNMTLTAQWSVATYTVAYLANGGTGSIPSATSYNFGSTITLAPAITKANSNFTGWSNGANTYAAGATFTIGARNETFTAQYSGSIYAISFNINGADTGTAPATITGQVTDNFILPTGAGLAETGYRFGGWSDGSNTYAAGETLTNVSANTTLTAIWTLLPPASLAAPVAVPGDSAGSVTVTPPSLVNGGPVTSYKIVATNSAGAPISPEKSCFINAPATSCVITGLTNGETYRFIATATNSAGTTTSAPSNAIIPASIPDAPTAVTATRGDESAVVAFTPPADNGGSAITSYRLTVVETGQTFTGSGSPITVTGLTNGSVYTFKVSAINAVGSSDSSTASAPIKVAGVADAPASVTAVAGDRTATVSATGDWSTFITSGGESVTSIVFTSTDGLHTCTATLPATSCQINGLINGTNYTFRAVARNAVGDSPATASNTVVPAGAPTAPTTVTAISGDRSATISFSGAGANGAAITGYVVKVSPTGETFTVSSSPAIINGLTNGGTYTFTVSAINSKGESAFSAMSATATPAAPPAAPTNLAVVAGDTSTVISWNAPTDDGGDPVTSYLVTASNGMTCTAIAPATSCKITGLTNGTSYTFTVQAINDIGTGVASANSPVSIPAGRPTPPTSLTATIGDGQVTVAFTGAGNNGSAITTYTVIAEPGGITGTSSSSPVTVLGLTNGTAYTFRVIATNGVGNSESSTATVTATPATVPDAPTSISASGGNASAQISWVAPVNDGGAPISGYTVSASPGGASCTAAANATGCTVSGLSNGAVYTFTVVANNAAGSSTPSASSGSVIPVGPPSAPTITEVVRGDTKATLTFTPPTNDNGSAVTQYVVTVQPGALTITAGSTTVEVTGLTNGVNYTFTVAAVNGVGQGAGSNAMSATPAGTPTAPTTISGTPANNGANLQFSGATGNGAPITGYIITVVETGETRTATSSPYRFGGLNNGTPYTFTVATVTSVGISAPSQISGPIIPEQIFLVVVTPSGSAPAPSAPLTPPNSETSTPVTPNPVTPNVPPAETSTASSSESAITPVKPVNPAPKPTPKPSVKPTPKPSVKPTPKPSVKPTPSQSVKPTTQPTPKPLAINPSTSGSGAKFGLENLKPGQKIKVTVKEKNRLATPKPTPQPSSRPPLSIVPKPSGGSAKVGVKNLKPGQKIKVTVKTGGSNK